MKAVTVTLSEEGGVQDVNFVEWILLEIEDTAFKQSQVIDTYAILLQKGMSPTDVTKVNTAIIQRWSKSGLRRIKEQAWKQAQAARGEA